MLRGGVLSPGLFWGAERVILEKYNVNQRLDKPINQGSIVKHRFKNIMRDKAKPIVK
jgi:hypothetical protein